MGHHSYKGADISESKLDNYVYSIYKKLKKGEYRVKASTRKFRCPFCVEKKGQEYSYDDLLQHAKRGGKSRGSDNLWHMGNHLALMDYLDRHHHPRLSSKPSEKSESYRRRDRNEETDISASGLDDHVYNVYKQLKNGDYRVKTSSDNFKCPFCVGKGPEYLYNDLLQHARELVNSYTTENVRQKGNHLALIDYLDKYHTPRMSSKSCETMESLEPSGKCKAHAVHDKSEKFVWPWKGIIVNIPVQKKGEKYVGDSASKLKDELVRKGFNPLKVIPLWGHQGHSGSAIVNFNKDFVGFGSAMLFEKSFASDNNGKVDWCRDKSHRDSLYAWIAREDDYYSSGIVGKHLRESGDLKSIADIEAEDQRKAASLISNLTKTIEVKKIQFKTMQSKLEQASASVEKLLQEKDRMTQAFDDEARRMRLKTQEDTKSFLVDHENFKKFLEYQKEKLERHEKELEKREAVYDNERIKIRRLRNESASLEQKKADDKMLALAEKHKMEKEELHKKIIDLEKQIDQRQALELDIEQLKGAAQVMEHMERDVETKKRMDEIQQELQEKEEELDDLNDLTQTLIVKERKCNDELQAAYKELINGLKAIRTVREPAIGVKTVGVLDVKTLERAVKEKYSAQEVPEKAEELISQWESYIEDPDWHPFRIMRQNGADKEVINEEDERLKKLRDDLGDEAYRSVVTFLSELNEFNPSGRYPVPLVWNFKAQRKATLKEGAEHILNQWKARKRKSR